MFFLSQKKNLKVQGMNYTFCYDIDSALEGVFSAETSYANANVNNDPLGPLFGEA